jgi:hypothetical protein
MTELNDQGTSEKLQARNMDLLSKAGSGLNVTVREDQYDFSWLLDAIRACRKKGGRFRLIDSGSRDALQLEWLLQAGADLFVSSETRRHDEELGRLAVACRKGRALLAYFFQAKANFEEKETDHADPLKLGRYGIYVHLSDREVQRDLSKLEEVAYSCRQGGSRCVYYHHGPLEKGLEPLAENGSWIHVLSERIKKEEEVVLAKDISAAARAHGSNMIVHASRMMALGILEEMIEARIILMPKIRFFDYKSPYKFLERVIAKTELPFHAYYLYPDIML